MLYCGNTGTRVLQRSDKGTHAASILVVSLEPWRNDKGNVGLILLTSSTLDQWYFGTCACVHSGTLEQWYFEAVVL